MKLMHVLGIVVLTALLSISGTFLIMKKNYENEGTKRVETESDNVQTISKEDEKEKFVPPHFNKVVW
ncbi:hypothetical protein [Lysinibacillus xylanilyticus]|uniref:Uncharacterized protein n=1 Tax=Lysinibacillus xylanilyticus TaxID=582475 RepID=A0A2M9QBQ0_9BACI|nr:hypothetical protein [Lysinibacillus xylanilyticus]PJO45494.1 hypothetical protein CWD94_00780 [Lysinibacillus xylanilyticus]